MGIKQHRSFCAACGQATNHVTVYRTSDDGTRLIAKVECSEHSDVHKSLLVDP